MWGKVQGDWGGIVGEMGVQRGGWGRQRKERGVEKYCLILENSVLVLLGCKLPIFIY